MATVTPSPSGGRKVISGGRDKTGAIFALVVAFVLTDSTTALDMLNTSTVVWNVSL